MDNEATKVLNEQQKETQSNVKDEKKGTNIFGQGMATAAGAAVGTGAAMAADRVYEHVSAAVEEEIPEEEQAEDVQAEETANEVVAEEQQEAVDPEPQVTTVHHVVTVKVEAPQAEQTEVVAENVIPADAELVDDNVIVAVDTPEDNEVHVIGAAVAETEDGGQAILMGLEAADGDRAMIVDIDSDGTIDYLLHDDNTNGQIEDGEIHDIHDEGWQTETYLSELDEQQAQQEMAMNDDDMPDYMNDADAGMMDA